MGQFQDCTDEPVLEKKYGGQCLSCTSLSATSTSVKEGLVCAADLSIGSTRNLLGMKAEKVVSGSPETR